MQPPFRLRTLGRLVLVDRDGNEDSSLGTRRRKLALLAVLAITRRPVSRDQLVAMFWGEQDEARARHSLSDALSHLRRVLGAGSITSHRADIAIDPSAALTVDLHELSAAAASRQWAEVIALYDGPFLDAVHVSGAPGWTEWADAVRATAERTFLKACRAECDRCAADGDHERRLAIAMRWLDADALSADAALHLLDASAAVGEVSGALAQYERLVRRLRTEFDTVPDAAVTARAEALRPVAATTSPVVPDAQEPDAEHPLRTRVPPSPVVSEVPAAPVIASTHSIGPSRRTRARIRQWGLAVAGFALLVAAGAWWSARATDHRARAALALPATSQRLLIADFRTGGLDSAVAQIVAEAVRMGLAESPNLRVVDDADIRAALRALSLSSTVTLDSAVAQRVAAEAAANAVVTGSVQVTGAGMLFTAELSSVGGDLVAQARAIAKDSSEIVQAADRLVAQLRTQAGRPLGEATSDGTARLSTGSLEALQRYAQALRVLERGGERDLAIALLDDAIAHDSTFALAHRRLALLYQNEEETRDRMVHHMTLAMRFADRLPEAERERTAGMYHMLVTADYTRAARALRTVLTLRPNDQGQWHNLGMVYQYVGDERRAADAYSRALHGDSARAGTWMNLIDARFAIGDTAGAWRALDDMARAMPGHSGVYVRAGMLAAASGQLARADSQFRALQRATQQDARLQSMAYTLLSNVHWASGDVATGDSLRRLAVSLDRARGASAPALQGDIAYATAAVWLRGDARLARTRLRAALGRTRLRALPVLDRPYLDLAQAWALAGDVTEAKRLVAEWDAQVPDAVRRQDAGARWLALGQIAMAERQWDRAIAAFREVPNPLCTVCGLAELAGAWQARGQSDSARIIYQRYLAVPSVRRVDATDGFHRVRALAGAR
jgi:DNA-binding SARP family transcriptional activator/tetratricopeptide (TPR) repeat protein